MAKKQTGKDVETQFHVDRWADLMKRIIKNPEIADRIPNDANLLFGEGDVVFINGEPIRYSELVRTGHPQRKTSSAKKKALSVSD